MVQIIENVNDIDSIGLAVKNARAETTKPSLIITKTHIGFGSPNKHDTSSAHGSPLGVEEVKLTKKNLGWPEEPDFFIPNEVKEHFKIAGEKGNQFEKEWDDLFKQYEAKYPDDGLVVSARAFLTAKPIESISFTFSIIWTCQLYASKRFSIFSEKDKAVEPSIVILLSS